VITFDHINEDNGGDCQVSDEVLEISESDRQPARLVLKSTLPVTCSPDADPSCTLSLSVRAMKGLAVRQRHPTLGTYMPCRYVFMENDWKPDESLAYNNQAALEITAKVVTFVTFYVITFSTV